MAKRCPLSGNDRILGNEVSFSNKKSNRSWAPNVRRVKAVVNGATKRINVCTRCLRSGKVERAL